VIARRQKTIQRGYNAIDSEAEDDEIDIALANDVVTDRFPTPGPRLRIGAGKSVSRPSAHNKGKGKAGYKPGPLPEGARTAAQELGRELTESAKKIAEQHGKTVRDILVQAGLTVKPSRAPNSANQHAEWFAHNFPKDAKSKAISSLNVD
jgi:hypothetical protein